MARNNKPEVETPVEDATVVEDAAATPVEAAAGDVLEEPSTAVEDAVADVGPDREVTLTTAALAEAIQTAVAKGRPDLFHNSPLSRATEALNHVELSVVPALTALILKEVFE